MMHMVVVEVIIITNSHLIERPLHFKDAVVSHNHCHLVHRNLAEEVHSIEATSQVIILFNNSNHKYNLRGQSYRNKSKRIIPRHGV